MTAAQTTPGIRKRTDRKRREEVLEVAAEVMKRLGVGQTRLQDVAKALGISYTGLYYYFESRDELAGSVLCWGISRRRSRLADAQGATALNRLMTFMESDLTSMAESGVTVPLMAVLGVQYHGKVRDQWDLLVAAMSDLVAAGLADGSIKPCHPLTVANVCLRILENSNLLQQGKESPAEVAMHVVRQLRSGIMAKPTDLTPGFVVERGGELLGTNPELDPELARLESLYRIATRHFNQQGSQLSIPRVAAEMGVSKTVIYSYIVDKQDLIYQCLSRGIQVVEMSHRIASDKGLTPLDEMLIHRSNLYRFHASEAGPFTLVSSLGYLPPQQARQIQLRNSGVRLTSEERVRRAVSSGELSDHTHPRIAQSLLGGTLYGLPVWFTDDYPLTIDEVCEQTASLLFNGLRA